ncbi:hypothetical protein, variant 1 [Aphanomyces invadans]|uniref:Inositol polyphosphate-related phosphatase domain-containing protein n=1 Tax=Aphanomyces invadans TaxID=157072 RepID=A0A024UVE4_9STRA|nr:hypothetical protein, variant 1 [Aphanomyces invadans]ETW09895.1 hypothetical protein, variant 1 [Aphanomyces invadans]|eukprot:XP_008861308.1 hypothetical protein, variant 1 [Aphanomyces invadans]
MADVLAAKADASSPPPVNKNDEVLHEEVETAHRKRKDERKAATRRRKHEKKNDAAVKIQAQVRGYQTRTKLHGHNDGPRLDQLPSPSDEAVVVPVHQLNSIDKSTSQLTPQLEGASSQQEAAPVVQSTAHIGPAIQVTTTVLRSSSSPTRLEPAKKLAPLKHGPTESAANAKCDAKPLPQAPTYEEQVRRATQIQATYRGHEGRLEASKQREEIDASLREEAAIELAREEDAATDIQALYRGHRIRECLADSKSRHPPTPLPVQAKGIPSLSSKTPSGQPTRSTVRDTKESKAHRVDDDDENKPRTWPKSLTLDTSLDITTHSTHDVTSRGRVRVFVMTWNLQAQKPPTDLRALLRPGSCHIYAIGTEECVQSIAKSVLFQSKKEWEDQLISTLGATYVKLRSHALTAMHNVVFVHTSILPLVSELHSDAIATGLGNQLGNKGGVGIGFVVGRTSFAFIGCHFEAHQSQQALARRNANFHKINSELQLVAPNDDHRKGPISSTFDRVFWSGDLNYRIDGTRKMIDDLLARNFHDVLLVNDQLRKEMAASRVFERFREGPLNFLPTYKFDKGCDVYDSSAKQRIPSWTDRILYFSTVPTATSLLAYESHMHVKTSDHRPVTAIFDVDFVSDLKSLDRAAPANQTKSEVCILQ